VHDGQIVNMSQFSAQAQVRSAVQPETVQLELSATCDADGVRLTASAEQTAAIITGD
jgi:hypothetical protein